MSRKIDETLMSELRDSLAEIGKRLEGWALALGADIHAVNTIGYYYDFDEKKYVVYVVNAHGNKSISLKTEDETLALRKVYSVAYAEMQYERRKKDE